MRLKIIRQIINYMDTLNVVREYTYGNNLYEVQAKYKADPKVSKLIRVIEIN